MKALLKVNEVDRMKDNLEYRTNIVLENMFGEEGKKYAIFSAVALVTQEIEFKGSFYKDIKYETELKLDSAKISFNLNFNLDIFLSILLSLFYSFL